jgi:hypothetical protein
MKTNQQMIKKFIFLDLGQNHLELFILRFLKAQNILKENTHASSYHIHIVPLEQKNKLQTALICNFFWHSSDNLLRIVSWKETNQVPNFERLIRNEITQKAASQALKLTPRKVA